MKYSNGLQSNVDRSQKLAGDVPQSIHVDISMGHRGAGGAGGRLGNGGGGSASFFEPWTPTPGSGSVVRGGPTCSSGSSGDPAHPSGGGSEPPEKKLTLFALRLSVLEKAASGLGKLDFVWATVVLLGGFVSILTTTDFWCITVILVSEGARVFSRSHELEWQHHATETASTTAGAMLRSSSMFFRRVLHLHAVTGAGGDAIAGGETRTTDTKPSQVQGQIAAVTKQRAWHAPDVSLVPYTSWLTAARNVGRLLNCLQVISAVACVALSVIRLWKHNFFFPGADEPKNMRPALLLFYTLALLEASLFLLEKAYWVWQFDHCKLLHQVTKDCHLGEYGPVALTRFFYDAYSRCIDGSIFDGIKMDLVTFAEDLILSDFLEEQLIGVRILEQFAKNAGSTDDTLRKIGTNPRSVERLVEMLNWKRLDEEGVRRSAAEVVSKLAGKHQNALRLSGIPGAIESVASLLYTGRCMAVSEILQGRSTGYDYLPLNLLGLRILKKLARDQDNCGKIENARGLLSKIIDFTRALRSLLENTHASDSQVRAVKRALQVVKLLVSTTGNTGEALRLGVASNVFAVSNLRGILRYGQQHRELQKLAIDVLSALAMEDKGKEAIMGTGGLVKLLLSMFAAGTGEEGGDQLDCNAGKALAMLALESEKGCAAILKRADVVDTLVSALQDGEDARRLNAARVLRSLCAYSGPKHRERLRVATKALPLVLRITMNEKELDKVLEVCVGLTTQICKFIDGERFAGELRGAGVEERAYVQRLARILRDYKYPEIRVPRMRRFVVQQVIWMMESSRGDVYVELLRERELGMEGLLESIADTKSELECYHVFSGSVGIGKHRESFSAIVDSAMELIAGSGGGGRAEG